MFADSAAGWQTEQYMLTVLIQIVRICAPVDWLPRRVRIATSPSAAPLPAEWSWIDVDWGWRRTEMLIEDEVLGLPPRFHIDRSRPSLAVARTERRRMVIQDLVDRQIWSHRHGLEDAARELGMSTATLKRRLADMNTSYSEILQERRLHHAVHMLDASQMSVGKIAEVLGYSAVSNFSRAFRKATGLSPGGWRKR